MGIKNKKMFYSIAGSIVVLGFIVVMRIIGGGWVETDDAFVEGRIHSIAAKIPGTVRSVNVEDNQTVKAGDILVEIDPVDFELRVKEAKANLDIRKTAFDQSERDRNRADALFKDNVLPKEKHENILTAFNLAKAQLDAAEAQLKIAERNLEYTKICAPVDGHVTKKSVEKGNQIQPMQPLMAVVSNEMWVVANFKETQLARMRPGQKVEIEVDAYPGKVFKGHVDSVQRGTGSKFSMFPPENAAGNFVKVVQRIPVKIVFDGPVDEKCPLSIGMSVIPKVKVR
ncbi:MAG TPA: HlyD family secretion protein [Candidatus Omnitrophota bacterium]|nr:HlyD family secretion protein [Candidatus Omnitrophota bacterium]